MNKPTSRTISGGIANWTYTTDDNGNITSDGTNAYTWNAANNLATVNSTAGVYTYNWLNQRSEKVTASATSYYVYGPDGLPYGEYDSSGTMIREYVYINGAPLAQIDAGSPDVLTYLRTDHLGTPRYATNQSGTQVWSWTNDAFGTTTPSGSVTVNLRMPGQYYDSESGLFYNWNRYYNPAIGRYISSDPIGIAGGLNMFGYVGQNPVNAIDPSGQNYAAPWTVSEVAVFCAANSAACAATAVGAEAVGSLAGGLGAGAAIGYYGLEAIPGIQNVFDWYVSRGIVFNNDRGQSSEEKSRQSKPKDCPPGTIPIDKAKKKFGIDKEKLHKIKNK